MMYFPESELILNEDGSVFHLHLKPEQLADTIILVGDPSRVNMVGSFFSNIECRIASREFITITGSYKGNRITVVGTGIGTDNIDIVMNELDSLANIDLETRTEKKTRKILRIIRIGSCGGMQPDLPVGTFLISEKSIAFDGMLYFYDGVDSIKDSSFEDEFCRQMNWPAIFNRPCVVSADSGLVDQIGRNDIKRGVTISANGFYGPQGRRLRIPLAMPEINDNLQKFRFGDYRITNYEMESSAVAGLSSLFGHKAMTICLVIANRLAKNANVNYQSAMRDLVETVLDRL